MSDIEHVDEGWLTRIDPGIAVGRAGGARCAPGANGRVLCSFVTQSQMGSNDFVPHLIGSDDAGRTWRDARPIWPDLAGEFSILVSLSRSPGGELLLFGSRCPIEAAGESFWSDQTQGLKANELVWSHSADAGRTWLPPRVIAMPLPGAAEAPGPMCAAGDGRWLCCYCPYPTFDPQLRVDRSKVIVLVSDDRGSTWQHAAMLSFGQPQSGGADARIIELADGRLLGAAWQYDLEDAAEYPIAYAITDDPLNWPATQATDIMGQAQSWALLADGRLLIAYTQRKGEDAGICLAQVQLQGDQLRTQRRDVIWRADSARQGDSAEVHSKWTDFAFGGPSLTVLDDAMLLVTYWVHQHDGRGVRYLRLRPAD